MNQPLESQPTGLLIDLLIRGGSVVSVTTGERFAADVAISGERIIAVLPAGTPVASDEVLEAEGQLIVPGYIDAHLHIESSFVTPAAFARLTLPRGTTTVLADPHEIVNVAGKAGLRWMIEAASGAGQSILFGVPSCVPSLPGFETAGATLSPQDVAEMLDWPGVIGLGEVMDYRAAVAGDRRIREIVAVARDRGRLIDGHCPGLTGEALSHYLALGIDSDHTKNATAVTLEKARLGMLVQLQEKSIRPDLIAALLALPLVPPLCLVTDDAAPDAIVSHGHLDHVARQAVAAGLPPEVALRAMTITPAQRLRLYDRGVVSPGKRADLLLLERLETFAPHTVVAGGRIVARHGKALAPETPEERETTRAAGAPVPFGDSVKLRRLTAEDFRWRLEPPPLPAIHPLRAIQANAGDTSTTPGLVHLQVTDGEVLWEAAGATLLTIWERHGRAGTHACAPVLGLGVGNGDTDAGDGAVATTYAHDSHNLLVLGTGRASMAAAANAVRDMAGGMAVVRAGRVVARLPLPVAGLMSVRPVAEVVAQARAVRAALEAWGYRHANPFMSLSTLSLPVSPRLKLTDLGLVDVERREWAPALIATTATDAAAAANGDQESR